MLLSVFEQAVTQIRNEESSAVEAMNAKLIDLQNGCRQDSKSALRFCNACSLQFALIGCPVSYDITHTYMPMQHEAISKVCKMVCFG